MTDEAKPKGTSTGRGLASIAGAKVYFLVTASAMPILLPRFLGSKEKFGFFVTALSLVSILNNVLIAATVQTLSKKVSDDEAHAPQVLRQGLILQLLWGGFLATAMFFLAPVIANHVMNNPAFTPLLRVSSAVIVAYALYAALVGSLNGRRMFVTQARLDMTFSTLRTVAILGLAGLGFGTTGAFLGFASAAVMILGIALVVVGPGKKGELTPWKPWMTFMAPLWVYQLCLNSILLLDIVVLTSTVTSIGMQHGLTHAQATNVADGLSGVYRAAQTFAFVPYQLILAVTFIVFPLVAKSTTGGDREATRQTITRALRFSFLVLLAMAAPVAGAARGVIGLVYKPEFLVGDVALRILVLGLVPFALFVITSTVLSGAGRAFDAARIAGLSLVVLVAAVWFLVRMAGPNDHALVGAACGTSLGALIALALSGALVYRLFGTFIPWRSAARGILAAAASASTAYFLPHEGKLTVLVALTAAFLVYVGALLVFRELTNAELGHVRSLVLKRLGRG